MRYRVEIFPLMDMGPDEMPKCEIDPGDVAWRWMAILHWMTPQHHPDRPGFACRRAMDPVKLARWAYKRLAREVRP